MQQRKQDQAGNIESHTDVRHRTPARIQKLYLMFRIFQLTNQLSHIEARIYKGKLGIETIPRLIYYHRKKIPPA